MVGADDQTWIGPEPLGVLDLSASEAIAYARAYESVLIQCMKTKGFEYQSTIHELLDHPEVHRTVGILTMAEAQKYGFHSPNPAVTQSSEQTQSQDYLKALMGDDQDQQTINLVGPDGQSTGESLTQGGCLLVATLTTYGQGAELEVQRNQLQNLRKDASVRAASDPRVVALNAEWNGCMAKAGYQVTHMGQVHQQYTAPGDSPSAEEIHVAVQDVTCRDSIDWNRRWLAVYFATEVQLLEPYPDLLPTFVRNRAAVIRRGLGLAG